MGQIVRNRCTCCQRWKPPQGVASSVLWDHVSTLLPSPRGVWHICDRWIARCPSRWPGIHVLRPRCHMQYFQMSTQAAIESVYADLNGNKIGKWWPMQLHVYQMLELRIFTSSVRLQMCVFRPLSTMCVFIFAFIKFCSSTFLQNS